MLIAIRELLLRTIDDIDSGNSNIDEADALSIVEVLREFTRKDRPLSKYSACRYLNISRASFDNLIRKGKIPKGKKLSGFKELMWTKKELDEVINNIDKKDKSV